MPQQLFSINQ